MYRTIAMKLCFEIFNMCLMNIFCRWLQKSIPYLQVKVFMNSNFDPFNLFSTYCTKRRYSEELGIISSIESTSRCWTRFNYRCFAGSDQCCMCFKRESYFLTHHYMYTYHYMYIFILFKFVLKQFSTFQPVYELCSILSSIG